MTVSRKRALKDRIRDVSRYIWMNEIKRELESDMLIGEDSLKNSFYFHLRNYMKYEIERDNLRLYTGYYVKQASEKADIVIAHLNKEKLREMKNDAENTYFGPSEALEILSVYRFRYQNYAGGADEFRADIKAVKEKFSAAGELSGCEYYLGFISEYFYAQYSWVDSYDSEKYGINELTAVWDEEENALIWHFY